MEQSVSASFVAAAAAAAAVLLLVCTKVVQATQETHTCVTPHLQASTTSQVQAPQVAWATTEGTEVQEHTRVHAQKPDQADLP